MFGKEQLILCELYGSIKATMAGYRSTATRQRYYAPMFTIEEFMDWLYKQDNFDDILNAWYESGFDAEFRPKMRINQLGLARYRLDNFELSNYSALNLEFRDKKNKIL